MRNAIHLDVVFSPVYFAIFERYRPARLDLNERDESASGIIEKPLKRTWTAISF
jgi:hypothetical protein